MSSPSPNPAESLILQGCPVAVAESLTGGGLAARLVDTPGISAVFRGGVVSYTNEIKASVLGVDRELLATRGPVCAEVAMQMASGVAKLLGAQRAVATTGVAGPGPADGAPAGTVWIGRSDHQAWQFLFPGKRSDVRHAAIEVALILLAGWDIPQEYEQFLGSAAS